MNILKASCPHLTFKDLFGVEMMSFKGAAWRNFGSKHKKN